MNHPPMSRMGQTFWQGGPQRPVGEMTNAAIIGTSATVFSDHIQVAFMVYSLYNDRDA